MLAPVVSAAPTAGSEATATATVSTAAPAAKTPAPIPRPIFRRPSFRSGTGTNAIKPNALPLARRSQSLFRLHSLAVRR
jgi:hypothetical protein